MRMIKYLLLLITVIIFTSCSSYRIEKEWTNSSIKLLKLGEMKTHWYGTDYPVICKMDSYVLNVDNSYLYGIFIEQSKIDVKYKRAIYNDGFGYSTSYLKICHNNNILNIGVNVKFNIEDNSSNWVYSKEL